MPSGRGGILASMRERWARTAVALVVIGGLSGCTDDELVPISEAELPVARAESECPSTYDIPTPFLLDDPTPVPYPTPAGDRVQPRLQLPVFPNAREVDGFKLKHGQVQMFETTASAGEVLDFYEVELVNIGLVTGSSGYGVAGFSCTFVPYYGGRHDPSLLPRVTITTEFVMRDHASGAVSHEPPPGFRGKGQRFAPPGDGKLWFFVITEE